MGDGAGLSAAERLEIVAACERLSLDYAHFADHRRTEDLAALFAPDGEMHLFGQVHVGPQGVLKAISGGEDRVSVHFTSNIRVEVEGPERASGSAYVTAYVAERGKALAQAAIAPVIVGVYRDAYRPTPEGWRFARRSFEPLISTGG